jgi:hypothetical protein
MRELSAALNAYDHVHLTQFVVGLISRGINAGPGLPPVGGTRGEKP